MAERARSLLSVTGAAEAATGMLLLAAPSVLVDLLLGEAPGSRAGETVTRIAGVALLALGVGCWLARQDATSRVADGLVAAMLIYNLGVVLLLAFAWASLRLSGIGLWPVLLAHAGLAAWCFLCLSSGRE